MTQQHTVPKNSLQQIFTITIPYQAIQKTVDQLIVEQAKKTKFPGFRPGKFPIELAKERFKDICFPKAVEKLIQEESKKKLSELSIRYAHTPEYNIVHAKENEDVVFEIITEKLPDIVLKDVSEVQIEKIDCDATEENFNLFVEKVIEFLPVYEEAPADQPVKDTDRVEVSLYPLFSDAKKKKNKLDKLGEQKTFILDENNPFSKILKESLEKIRVGQEIECAFTANDQGPKNNKKFESFPFRIKFLKHEVKVDKKKDIEEISKEFGYTSLDELKQSFFQKAKHIRRHNINLYHKRLILDRLDALYDFELPSSLVQIEFKNILNQLFEEFTDEERQEYQGEKLKELQEEYLTIAKRRVKLGLLISEISSKHDISLSKDEVFQIILEDAARYGVSPEKSVKYYSKNPTALKQLVVPALENKVIQFLLDENKAEPKSITAEEMKNLLEGFIPDFEDLDSILLNPNYLIFLLNKVERTAQTELDQVEDLKNSDEQDNQIAEVPTVAAV